MLWAVFDILEGSRANTISISFFFIIHDDLQIDFDRLGNDIGVHPVVIN